MRRQRVFCGFVLVSSALLLSGCGNSVFSGLETEPFEPVGSDSTRERLEASGAGSIFDMIGGREVGNVTFGGPRQGEALAGNVNRHIWSASLDTLSFLPIASTDPFTGVIATDWGGVSESATERFRVTAFVTDVALAPESLRVAVFREVRGTGGAWVPAPVAADTPRQIEDSILVRARQIRLAEREAG